MLDWLKTFGDVIVQLCEFAISFFKNVIELFVLLFKAFSYLYSCILFLPIQYQVVILALVSFSLIVTIVHLGE